MQNREIGKPVLSEHQDKTDTTPSAIQRSILSSLNCLKVISKLYLMSFGRHFTFVHSYSINNSTIVDGPNEYGTPLDWKLRDTSQPKLQDVKDNFNLNQYRRNGLADWHYTSNEPDACAYTFFQPILNSGKSKRTSIVFIQLSRRLSGNAWYRWKAWGAQKVVSTRSLVQSKNSVERRNCWKLEFSGMCEVHYMNKQPTQYVISENNYRISTFCRYQKTSYDCRG